MPTLSGRRSRRRGGWIGALAVLAALSGAPPGRAETRTVTLFDFAFESGEVMPDLRIAYETHGTLASGRDNAILLLPAATGDRHAFDAVIGPGKTFDTDKYFIVTADPIGGGESSSPAEGAGQDFPRYSVRDMMLALQGLIAGNLNLTELHAIAGSDLGAFIALEWAIHYPQTTHGVILLAPSSKADANYRLVVDLMTSVVALDPKWQGGRYSANPIDGLRHAGMLYYPWSTSAAFLDRGPPRRVAKEIEATARSFAAWDANSLVLRYAACRGHDVSGPFEGSIAAALARVTAPVLLLPSVSDRLIGTDDALLIRGGVRNAVYAEIPGDLGHRAIRALPETLEWDFIDRRIRAFLATLN